MHGSTQHSIFSLPGILGLFSQGPGENLTEFPNVSQWNTVKHTKILPITRDLFFILQCFFLRCYADGGGGGYCCDVTGTVRAPLGKQEGFFLKAPEYASHPAHLPHSQQRKGKNAVTAEQAASGWGRCGSNGEPRLSGVQLNEGTCRERGGF